MTPALVTVVCPLAVELVPDAERAIDALGNPARPDIATALNRLDGDAGTHFASLHAVPSCDGKRAYLVLELSADGPDEEAIRRIADAIGDNLQPIFLLASDWASGPSLGDYLLKHRVSVGGGWFSNPGAVFSGTPGFSVGQIHLEAALAERIGELLGEQGEDHGALQRVDAVRERLAHDPRFAACLQPAGPEAPFNPLPILNFIIQLITSFAATYLWPAGIVLLVWAVVSAVLAWPDSSGVLSFVWDFGGWFLSGVLCVVIVVLAIAGVAYLWLRKAEATDWLEERTADTATLRAIFERENRLAQNHMISVTQRKPGLVRKFTSRLIFWAIVQFATYQYRPGFLSDIGTIHFARWVTPPGSPDVLFFSNYDGSWESYLEDFITLAHAGLTGVWSNSIGFPRTVNLIEQGATDGERFKRYARHSMRPTRFWFSAYPHLTTNDVRTNGEIRRGLSGTMTEDEAVQWLASFGSAARPAFKMVTSEIQSLVFGGLSFMPFGTCLLLSLPRETPAARAWLRDVAPHVAFDDGRRLGAPAIITLALGAPGLARLGLPEEGLNSFPFAFREGMVTEARSRILGDVRGNGHQYWWWGQAQPDAVLLVYGRTAEAVAKLQGDLDAIAARHGAACTRVIPLKEITADKREAFGFVDGISQPVIRGTHKALHAADSIHVVAPGEFVLGYPDNRDNFPPGPTLPALADQANLLPLVGGAPGFSTNATDTPRDLGCNGSFLVIRQLEQDRDAFDTFCTTEAERLKHRLPPPYEITPDFIAAKLVGRWRDGSSLVRHPYNSQTGETAKEKQRRAQHAEAAAPGEFHTHPDNKFLFGTEDPEALRCPFAAHIRRANPRDSFNPGSEDQIAISNRHRIMRVGRQYRPEGEEKPGLLFMCLNGDIERQFEFVQQTWVMNPGFHGLSREKDPLLGDGEDGECGFTIPSRHGPVRLSEVPRFITTRGGGYFFMPGKRLIDYLSTV
nr:hypothetical protein [uncultured Rhodopila sp.]